MSEVLGSLSACFLPSLQGWHHEIMFATVHVTDDDVSFCDGPAMLIRTTAKPCINSMLIALLIHGFVPVKTWLLKACDTAFYAIINILSSIKIYIKEQLKQFMVNSDFGRFGSSEFGPHLYSNLSTGWFGPCENMVRIDQCSSVVKVRIDQGPSGVKVQIDQCLNLFSGRAVGTGLIVVVAAAAVVVVVLLLKLK